MADDRPGRFSKLEALTAVRGDRTLDAKQRLVLVMLISHADAQGQCYPAMTTLAAETAHTSDRSYWLSSGARVFRFTLGSPRSSVEIGFIVPRTTTGWPLVMPPSSPPALFVGLTNPSVGPSFADSSYPMGS